MKQMEVTEIALGEYMFYLKPFPAFKAANISGEIATLVVPVLGAMLPLLDNNSDTPGDAAVAGLAQALGNLSGDQLEKLVRKLLIENNNISVEGEATNGKARPLNQDLANEIFCGDVFGMFQLCWEVLKLNYSGFFEKLKGTQFGSLLTSTVTEAK